MGLFSSHSKRSENSASQLFEAACAQADPNTSFLLRASDLYPVHIAPSFQHVFGVEPARLVDDVETLLRFVPDEDRARIKRIIGTWDRTTPLTLDSDYRMPNDAAATKHIRATFTSVEGGEYTLVTATDVTDEHETIETAREQESHAMKNAQERTDFMSQLSHEIRTPLNGIKGMIALAQEHHTKEKLLLDDLVRATKLSDYLLSLVNDVLDMSRLNSGHVELEARPFDIRLVTNELVAMFEAQAREKGIDYRVETEDCHSMFLIGDRMRLNQIIVNFISNALKFTDAGGHVTVTFREMYRRDDEVNYMIRVRDTGKGMDPRFTSRIFKPFEQEDRTIARRYGGTGLGMAITGALVELMQGEIVVDTELGRGTDFTTYIPFGLATQQQADELASAGETLETFHSKESDATQYNFEGKHFLMAEDNDFNAEIAIELLGTLGVTVDHANDGPMVVDMFEKAPAGTYDAILMDIQMPTFNGWEATRRIRALDKDDAKTVPIIALSANNYVEDARQSREAGMNGHMGKPIEMDELKAQLAAATAESAYLGGK